MNFRMILPRPSILAACMLMAAHSALEAQQPSPIQIAAVQWQESPGAGYAYNRQIRIALAQPSLNRLRTSRFRVRIVTGDRAALLNLRPERDGCVTIPAFTYAARLYGSGIWLTPRSQNWLAKHADGRAAGRVYMVFVELGEPTGEALRIRHSDLRRYLDSGLPIVIEPPRNLNRRELIALGRRISPGRPLAVVPACRRLEAHFAGTLNFVAAACGAGDEGEAGAGATPDPGEVDDEAGLLNPGDEGARNRATTAPGVP